MASGAAVDMEIRRIPTETGVSRASRTELSPKTSSDKPSVAPTAEPPWGDCPYPHAIPSNGTGHAVHVHGSRDTSATFAPSNQPNTLLESRSGSQDSQAHSHPSGTCCSKSTHSSDESLLNHLGAVEDRSDVEKGPPNFERILLRIDGLKCGCCEGGISRAVSRIPAIKNHQVNIVLARLEFDLDVNRLSVYEVIRRLSAKTGYIFEEQITSPGQTLEFVASDPIRIKNVPQPDGVLYIEAPERRPWRPGQLLKGRISVIGRIVAIPHAAATPTQAQKVVSENVHAGLAPSQAYDNTAVTASKRRLKLRAVRSGQPQIRLSPTRLHYDATIIGARDIFDGYKKFDPDLRLAPPASHPGLALGAKQTRRALKWFLPTLALTLPVVVLAWAPIDHEKSWHAHLSLALATLVQLIALKELVPGALRSLYHSGVFEMDFLIAFSTTVAYIFSVVSYSFETKGKPLETGSFFEASTLLVTLILLGRVINEFARFRAAKSVSFRSLQIDEALIVLPHSDALPFAVPDANAKIMKIDSRLLQYGDTFKVPPHTKVVTDGIIVYGGSEIDESMITGESIPVAKSVGSEVFAGTNNGSGLLMVKLTNLPHENSVHKIAAMVEDAELTKPKVQALADRIAGWFVPAIATIGFIVFLIWLFVDRYLNDESWKSAAITAITYSIATLIVSCPCAIGLAVPMVVLIAGGVAARFGIIFRDPQKLEIARNVTDVVFDKTGTLTCGFPRVVGTVKYHGTDKAATKAILMGLLKDIKHPVSAGVMRYLEEDMREHAPSTFRPTVMTGITSLPAEGVIGTCADTGVEVRVGNPEWLEVNEDQAIDTVCCVKIGGVLSATFKLADNPRHTAEMVVEKLHARGIAVHMISGDNEGSVANTAGALHIRRSNTKSRCKPEGKMNYVKDLQQPGKVVMFVGDGTNDSVALKQADVGVHIDQGSDVAKSAADVVLMTTRLHDVLILLDISRAAYRRIILNFTWSALYNILAILLSSGAFVKAGENIRISPTWAGLGELVSVLPVVLIAFQMRWRNYGARYRKIEYDYLRAEMPMREHKVRMRASVSSADAGCCEVLPATLAKIDAMTRRG